MQTLETERLILRTVSLFDIDDFFEYCQNSKIGQMAGWKPPVIKDNLFPALQKMISDDNTWAIVYKDNNKVIGAFHLIDDQKRNDVSARMISYSLSEEYWGKGLMTEATKRVIRYVFEELSIDIISVYHYPFNHASRRVIENCGFVYEGTLRYANKIYNGNIYADVCYSILKSEYFR